MYLIEQHGLTKITTWTTDKAITDQVSVSQKDLQINVVIEVIKESALQMQCIESRANFLGCETVRNPKEQSSLRIQTVLDLKKFARV